MERRLRYSAMIMAFIMACTIGAKAQEKPSFKWKIYVGDHEGEKRVYVHDSLPVYFFMSAENDPKNAVRLESKSKYANPMEFDGHGTHYMRHKDKEYEQEILFEVYADGIAPKTSVDYGSTITYKKGGKTYCGKSSSIQLKTKDEMSGVQKTFYSLDNAAFAASTAALPLSQEKEYVLKYFAADNVGNVEKTRSETFMVDLTAPTSQHEVIGDLSGNVVSARSKIKLTSEDASSGVKKTYYRIDDGPEKVYYSNLNMYSLSEGEHTLYYYAEDNVKNKAKAYTYKFFVDKTAPVVTDEVIGDKYVANGKEYVSGRSKYKLMATDNKAGVKEIMYSFNGKGYKTYTGEMEFPENVTNLYIKANATDKVNNKSKSANPSPYIRYVDTKPPTLSHSYRGPSFTTRDTIFISDKTSIILKAADYASGVQKIEYQINEGATVKYDEPFNVNTEGVKNTKYSALDNVNNLAESTFTFVVDMTAPEIFTRFSIESIGKITLGTKTTYVYAEHVGLFLSATDAMSGLDKIYYSINGAPEKLYTQMIKGFKKGKTYVVSIRSLDKLGNESTSTVEFSIFDGSKN